jgi:hypothetical protein
MPRPYALAQQVDGMSALRPKGGASDKGLTLLRNGWITSARTMQARPGSVEELEFPEGSVGVVAFEDKFYTFAGGPVSAPADPRIEVEILLHPSSPGTALTKIWEAFPFLGRLYVVAEFADGVVQHYWVEDPPNWSSNAEVASGGVIQPTSETGYYYENISLSTTPAWQANTDTAIGEFKQPTIANGYRYEAVASTGTPPLRTSNYQPTWPTVVGAQVIERRYITDGTQVLPGPDTPSQPPPGQGGGGGAGGEYGPFPPSGGGSEFPQQAL